MGTQKRARKISGFKMGTGLEEMLRVKTFDELIKDGDVFDVNGAAAQTGYSPKHIHRLCRERRIGHVCRGLVEKEVQLYFLAWQLRGIFRYKKARIS